MGCDAVAGRAKIHSQTSIGSHLLIAINFILKTFHGHEIPIF